MVDKQPHGGKSFRGRLRKPRVAEKTDALVSIQKRQEKRKGKLTFLGQDSDRPVDLPEHHGSYVGTMLISLFLPF